MTMRVVDIIRKMEERGENRLMLLYRDEKGKMKSLAYQDLMFFEPVADRQYRILGNPSKILSVFESLENGKCKMVGRGYYSHPVKFH